MYYYFLRVTRKRSLAPRSILVPCSGPFLPRVGEMVKIKDPLEEGSRTDDYEVHATVTAVEHESSDGKTNNLDGPVMVATVYAREYRD